MTVSKKLVLLSILFGTIGVIIHCLIFYGTVNFIIEYPLVKSLITLAQNYGQSGSISSIPETEKKKKSTRSIKTKPERLFTEDELKEYDGSIDGKGPYLALLGRVFDVSKKKEHYGVGGGYGFFSGCDASRAYVTGNFKEDGLVADVAGLSSQDYIGLETWMEFYEKDYTYVGKLVGLHYDERGERTPYNIQVLEWTSKAHTEKEAEDRIKEVFPGCNSEYFPETGTRVWCTSKSGGVRRDWVGVPRKFYTPGKHGAKCVCVRVSGPPSLDGDPANNRNDGDLSHPSLKEFDNCPPMESTCRIPKVT